MAQSEATIHAIMNHAGTSHWARSALRDALERDPIDAANDAEMVADLLAGRAAAMLASAGEQVEKAGA